MISIIVPTYNRSDSIRKIAKSILDNIPPDWELVVVDDGSTDDTFAVLSQLSIAKNFKLFKTENNGPSAARNFGASMSSKKYLKFHDSDDIFMASGVMQLLSVSESKPENIICVGDAECADSDGILLSECCHGFQKKSNIGFIPDDIFFKFDVASFIPLWRKSVFFQIGGFDLTVDNGEDTLLAVKAYVAGFRFYRVNCVVAVNCEHDGPRLTKIENKDIYLKKQFKKFELLAAIISNTPSREVKTFLATRIWGFGRLSLHFNKPDIAVKFFKLSSTLSYFKDLKLSFKYKVFCFLSNPYLAEKFFIKIAGNQIPSI